MSAPSRQAVLRQRFARLKAALGEADLMVQGSILRRIIRRDDPQTPGTTKDYGPYYQWTRKRQGRTVLQNLTAGQAQAYGRAIRENQRLEKILAQMRDVSLKLLDLTTSGVKKRRRPENVGRSSS
ncbi:MAG: hypothetical protein NTW86_14930 [Candidatus Sumerlaeota bacterium]|nr:hypothetical protein [Candidatus Sumerlaeota bacterium]